MTDNTKPTTNNEGEVSTLFLFVTVCLALGGMVVLGAVVIPYLWGWHLETFVK